MGWDRKIFPIWILFAGSLIGSCVAQSYLQPNIATTYDATTYGYIQSSCYDSTRKIAFIGTTAINGQKSHVIPFNVSTQSFGTPVPTEEPSSLDVCVFDPVQNYVYYVTGATQSDSEITIIRVNVATTTPGSSDVSYAVLYANPAQLDLINFGVFIDTDLVAFVGKGMTRIPMAQLIFNPTIDNTNATENTEAVTLFWDPTVGTFISGFTDGPIGYFVSTQNPARMYSVNLTADGDPGIDKNNLTIVGSGVFTIGPIQDCVYDSGRRLAYCWNSVPGQRSQVVRMDVVSLNQTGVVQLGPNSKETTVAVMDTQHGQLYVGGGATTANQGFVSQVSLKTLTLNPAVDTDVQLLGGQKYLKIGWLVDDQTLNIGYGYSYVNNSGSNLASAGVFSAELPAVCPGTPECSGKGECVYATCICNNLTSSEQVQYPNSTAYAGDKCDTVNCKYDCTNNVTGFVGTCNAGICLCGANYTGDFCETQQCPYGCSQRGFCNVTAAYTCECNPGWSGAGCEDQIPVTCSSHKNCKDCLSDTSCGWCRSEGKCTEGDLNGPFESGESGCTSWYFTQCPEVGMEFFGYLFTILAGIMILINIVSLVQEEANPLIVNKTSDLDIRETWWRNQRSVKTWLMVDEIQFAAITAMFAVKSPSLYFNFVTIFRWSVIGFPLPWSQRDFDTGRDTLSMDQYSSSILSKDTEVFFGSLFWLAMLIGFTVLVFLVLRVFGRICFASDYGIRNFFKNRLVYTLVRIAMFIYFPFAVFTTYSFTVDSAGAIVISIIFLLLVHIPLAIFLWRIQPKSKKDSTKLFRPEFLNRYGCLYHSFYVKRAWFQEVVFLRKLAMGAIVGLLQGSETAQLIILMIIQASYLIAVLVLQPFLDSMHMFIEISSSIGHLIMIALMFPFIGSLNLDMTDDVAIFLSVAIAAISLILQLICIGGFINNWMKMNNIASFMDLVDRCRGGSGSGKAIDVELDLTRSKQK